MDPSVEVVIGGCQSGENNKHGNNNNVDGSDELLLSPTSLKFVPALDRKGVSPSSIGSSSTTEECHIIQDFRATSLEEDTTENHNQQHQHHDKNNVGSSKLYHQDRNGSSSSCREDDEDVEETQQRKTLKKSLLSKFRRINRSHHPSKQSSTAAASATTISQPLPEHDHKANDTTIIITSNHSSTRATDHIHADPKAVKAEMKHDDPCNVNPNTTTTNMTTKITEEEAPNDDKVDSAVLVEDDKYAVADLLDNDNQRQDSASSSSSAAEEASSEVRTIELLTEDQLKQIWGKERLDFAHLCTIAEHPEDVFPSNNQPSSHQQQQHQHHSPSWASIDAQTFSVRTGPNYAKKKKKSPSASSLYELVEVRLFESKSRTFHIVDNFPLPTHRAFPQSKVPIINPNYPHVPELLVVHFHFPSESPNFFKPKDDGEGGELVLYLKPSKHFLDQLNNNNNNNNTSTHQKISPAVKLFAEWCTKCTDSIKWRSRFKCMALVRDLEKHNISILKPYNGKPVLITESGTVRRGTSVDGIRFLEFNANVHKWSFIAKKGFHTVLPKLKEMNLDVGFTIEAMTDEEMPERILGSILLNNIDPNNMHSIPTKMQSPPPSS